MICFLEKECYELKDEVIISDVLTMTWGEKKFEKFKGYPGIVQILVNKSAGPYVHSFSDYPVKADTILTINGLPPNIQSIQILVI